MNYVVEGFDYLLRRIVAALLLFSSLIFALIFVGVSNATTDATATQLYVQASIYLLFVAGCLAVAMKAKRAWLCWSSLLLGSAPLLLFAGSFYA